MRVWYVFTFTGNLAYGVKQLLSKLSEKVSLVLKKPAMVWNFSLFSGKILFHTDSIVVQEPFNQIDAWANFSLYELNKKTVS